MLWYPGCAGWHGAANTNWISMDTRGFVRGNSGVFSFNNNTWTNTNNVNMGRGVAVVGTGL